VLWYVGNRIPAEVVVFKKKDVDQHYHAICAPVSHSRPDIAQKLQQ
jgi:hypothetical protein